jgi:glucose/arabinose dehydrogenase
MNRIVPLGFAICAAAVIDLALLGFALAPATAQRGSAARTEGDPASLPDQQLGRRIVVKAEDLPPPGTGPVVSNHPLTIPFHGQAPRVPEGFSATLFASGLRNPRRLLVLPNGDVLVAEQRSGYLTLLHDGGKGRAESVQRYVQGFHGPYGLAWRDNEVLVADQDGIWKVPYQLGADGVPPDRRAPTRRVVRDDMITKKGVFGIVQGHANRHLAIDPKSGALFVGVGSSGNIGVEPEPKATIQRFEADGSGQSTYASGTRNSTALAFQPGTGDLYAVVQERDGLGDRLVPDFMIRVQKGAFYGWPYAYIGQHPQPGFANLRPDKVRASVMPDLLFESHSSLLDLVFYEGEQFPAEWRGSAFVALRGSWNRSQPTGYKVVRVPFKDGRPEGGYENFMVGFWTSGLRRAEVWGRPAALAVAKDGALLVADDTGGTIWRVAYTGPQQTGEPPGTTGGR